MSTILLSLLFVFVNVCLSANDSFWGVSYISTAADPKDLSTSGYANVRWNIPHSSQSRFPLGSNTKLFATVSIYQLQENGLLNVSDPINKYLNHSDFISFGYPNITYWCPTLLNDTDNCIDITFIELLSMSSGIIPAIQCPFNSTSPYKQFCWDICTSIYVPYQGSLAYYVSTFILSPLTFKPGTIYQYSNMNFILAGYLIEKLSGMKFREYIQENILDVVGLENIYFDPWDGEFAINRYRVDEYFLFQAEEHPFNNLAVGWCAPYGSLGAFNTCGGMVGSNVDMHKWYNSLFNPSDAIPKVFKRKESRAAIVYPWTWMAGNMYYGQGIMLEYEDITQHNEWPNKIMYEGGTICSNTAIAMIPNETMLIVSAFSNAPHVYIKNGEKGYNKLRDDTPESFCAMKFDGTTTWDNGGAMTLATELLREWE